MCRSDANDASPRPPNSHVLRYFGRYVAWTLRRNFHAVRVAGTERLEGLQEAPLVVFSNHPAWWDPLMGLQLHRSFFSERRAHAPIEAKALERYGIFNMLGFFGVEPGQKGARTFLRIARTLVDDPEASLWLTPEGELRDPRERPVRFEPGLAHVAAHAPRAVFLPVAYEYPFGYERKPEALAQFGEPISGERFAGLDTQHINVRLEAALTHTMDELATAVLTRDWAHFPVVWQGSAGTDLIYDTWRRVKRWFTGETYAPEHESVIRSKF